MTDNPNVHEERARSIKAFKLSRVMRTLTDRNPHITIDRLRAADPTVRAMAARVAKVKQPSDRTWQLAVDMLTEVIAGGGASDVGSPE